MGGWGRKISELLQASLVYILNSRNTQRNLILKNKSKTKNTTKYLYVFILSPCLSILGSLWHDLVSLYSSHTHQIHSNLLDSPLQYCGCKCMQPCLPTVRSSCLSLHKVHLLWVKCCFHGLLQTKPDLLAEYRILKLKSQSTVTCTSYFVCLLCFNKLDIDPDSFKKKVIGLGGGGTHL